MNRNAKQTMVHFIAKCKDCDWRSEDYINGAKKAAAHARRFKHHVITEKGYTVHYNRKETEK